MRTNPSIWLALSAQQLKEILHGPANMCEIYPIELYCSCLAIDCVVLNTASAWGVFVSSLAHCNGPTMGRGALTRMHVMLSPHGVTFPGSLSGQRADLPTTSSCPRSVVASLRSVLSSRKLGTMVTAAQPKTTTPRPPLPHKSFNPHLLLRAYQDTFSRDTQMCLTLHVFLLG